MVKSFNTGKPAEKTGKSPAGRSSGNAAVLSGPRQAGKLVKDPGDTTIIVHTEDGEGVPEKFIHPRNSGVVHRAMKQLEAWKFLPARIIIAKVPVDIVALREDMDMLVQVITSRQQIPDAKTLIATYPQKIGSFCRMKTSAQFRKLLMAYSTLRGWKYYNVLPGGLMPAWDLIEDPLPKPARS